MSVEFTPGYLHDTADVEYWQHIGAKLDEWHLMCEQYHDVLHHIENGALDISRTINTQKRVLVRGNLVGDTSVDLLRRKT